ncbi:hypothetical protein K438DRAFT_1989883 [Mycena galopus ATCC 62051]|nr:hypothetical protein K438DRAFT_1989883 [Mycena galopus ATCC 62051]
MSDTSGNSTRTLTSTPTTNHHHHHRECSLLIVSDSGDLTLLVARRVGHRRRLDSYPDPDSHHTSNHHHHRECASLVVSDSGDLTRTPTPTPTRLLTTATTTANPDPDSHPDPTLTTTTASARRSSCWTAATRLTRRHRLAPPPPTRTTASARRSSCRAFVRMRLYTQADVDHALNTPPSPSDHPGKVYGLRVKHPDGSVVLKDNIVLLWELPTNHASKLERLCHRLFKANDAWMTSEGCESCGVFHREKFLADELGGSDEGRKLVEQMAKKMRDRGE